MSNLQTECFIVDSRGIVPAMQYLNNARLKANLPELEHKSFLTENNDGVIRVYYDKSKEDGTKVPE